MGDNLRFFSSASPDSSHGHGHTPDGYGPGFAGPWIEPGAYSDYGPEDYAARAEEELQRLISTDGPTTSWLYSDYYSDSQPDAHAPTTGPAPIQREMTVGSANDPLEEEADAVAERVMRNPRDFYLDPRVSSFQPYQIGGRGEQVVARLARAAQEEEAAQLKAEVPEISHMGEQDEEMQYKSVQRNDAASPEGGTVSPELQRRIEGVRNSGGEKLPDSEREFFESRMGHDFGDVRIHTGSEAAQVSRDVNAKAFTIGRDVVFGEGEYRPGTTEGRRLMAHELTHTVQQGAAGAREIQRLPRAPMFHKGDITFHQTMPVSEDGVGWQTAQFPIRFVFGDPVVCMVRVGLPIQSGSRYLSTNLATELTNYHVLRVCYPLAVEAQKTASLANPEILCPRLVRLLQIDLRFDEKEAVVIRDDQIGPESVNQMRFQVQWDGSPEEQASPAKAPASRGVTTGQAERHLYTAIEKVSNRKARRDLEPAKKRQLRFIKSAPPGGVIEGRNHSQYFESRGLRNARVDVENLRGHNLRFFLRD
jgi:hypothetical protein